jgi:hypothetical protein
MSGQHKALPPRLQRRFRALQFELRKLREEYGDLPPDQQDQVIQALAGFGEHYMLLLNFLIGQQQRRRAAAPASNPGDPSDET